MARPARLERATNGFEDHYSIQLSYGRRMTSPPVRYRFREPSDAYGARARAEAHWLTGAAEIIECGPAAAQAPPRRCLPGAHRRRAVRLRFAAAFRGESHRTKFEANTCQKNRCGKGGQMPKTPSTETFSAGQDNVTVMNTSNLFATRSENDAAFADLVADLIGVLHQELRHNHKLLQLLHAKKLVETESAEFETSRLLRQEKEVLGDCVTFERERRMLLLALGEHITARIGHPTRIAELVGYCSPEARDELLDLREEFRDLADELEALSAVEARFVRHASGNIRLYLRDAADGATSRIADHAHNSATVSPQQETP